MRQPIVLTLIVFGILAGAAVTIFVRDTVIDSNEFAGRTADALTYPAVEDLIAVKVVN